MAACCVAASVPANPPFEDGNGRVGRAISSLVLIEDGWLPLTVTRTDRLSYIDALRAADGGDLGSLVRPRGDAAAPES